HGAAAGALAAQAEVDGLGGVGVRGHAADRTARRPDDRVGDVGVVAAAPAEHAHRDDLGAERGARPALGVVGQRRHGAGHVGAMPAGGVAAVVVARVARVAVAAVAVAGHRGAGDEVVARQHVGVEVAVAGDAGVEHGHDRAGAAGGVPGLGRTDAARTGAETPLLAEIGVVGGERQAVELVHLDVFHVRVGRQLAHQHFGLDAVELAAGGDDFGTDCHAALVA